MKDAKLFAGHAVRRLRRAQGLTQVDMAAALDVSPSYLNLIERNQRPLTAALIVRLGERFDFDARTLAGAAPGGGVEAIRRRLSDPAFADLSLDRAAISEWTAAFPDAAEAFARAFDRGSAATTPQADDAPLAVRREIERWRNHFPDLEALAEGLADDLRVDNADMFGAMAERLRVRHHLSIRILPTDVMPAHLRRLDLHARQLQISEWLSPASRSFAVAYQLAQLEAATEIDSLVVGARFAERASERLYRRHLTSYVAAALMMPYARFVRACERSGYDIDLLQHRFGAGFEQVAHRLTTLHRIGARGLPFFMVRIDRAGQASKLYAGASGAPLAEPGARCPLWSVHRAFERRGETLNQWVELEDGSRWFTLARTVQPSGPFAAHVRAEFVVAIGVRADLAQAMTAARAHGESEDNATPIGLGCVRCTRRDCAQRSMPPQGHGLNVDDRERGLTPFAFGNP